MAPLFSCSIFVLGGFAPVHFYRGGLPVFCLFRTQTFRGYIFVQSFDGELLILKSSTFEDIRIKGDTSDVACMASVSNVIKIESDTGNIKVDGISAEAINFSTDTGNINISSITSKGKINVETSTGRISVPKTTSGGKCEIITATGDVEIDVTP